MGKHEKSRLLEPFRPPQRVLGHLLGQAILRADIAEGEDAPQGGKSFLDFLAKSLAELPRGTVGLPGLVGRHALCREKRCRP